MQLYTLQLHSDWVSSALGFYLWVVDIIVDKRYSSRKWYSLKGYILSHLPPKLWFRNHLGLLPVGLLPYWRGSAYFSLVTPMRWTYHPTLGSAPNATCLRKCWMRAWTELTFSPTSWLTCTVSGSSFGRWLGDVCQGVSNWYCRATTNPFCWSEIKVLSTKWNFL